jgi:hypothetical protein
MDELPRSGFSSTKSPALFFDLCLNMAGSCSRRFAGRRTNEAHTMYPVLPFDTLPGAAQTILAFFALLAAALNLMLSARA